jgi:hypothetical protein
MVTLQPLDERSKVFKHPENELWANVTLLRNGYLASSPSKPVTAFSLQLLDVLAAVQRRGPSVSIQTMAKAFCDLRNVSLKRLCIFRYSHLRVQVPYQHYFRAQLTSALDAYHLICRCVQQRLDSAFGRDSPDWRLRNSCTHALTRLVAQILLHLLR